MTQEKVEKSSKREEKKASDDRKKDHPPTKVSLWGGALSSLAFRLHLSHFSPCN